MPRKEVDYSKTVIYKIVCNDLLVTDLYVGHTTHFRNRKNCHKCDCKTSDLKIYKTIRDNGNWENWTMAQIEEFPCANGNEARARERHWYEQLNATLNTVYPQRNLPEYYVANRNKILDYQKEYKDINKDKIKDGAKKYYDEIKDNKRQEYLNNTQDQRKQYLDANKDKIIIKKKEWYEKNKDKILEDQRSKYTCECGTICRHDVKAKHFRTKKHINYLNLQKKNI
jgi:hypothetical protein